MLPLRLASSASARSCSLSSHQQFPLQRPARRSWPCPVRAGPSAWPFRAWLHHTAPRTPAPSPHLPSFTRCHCPFTLPGLPGEVLELSVTHAIRAADWRTFELQVTQALPLYTAGAFGQTVPAREGWRLLTGLQLMHLLVEARLSDFHCRVEALSEEDTASAPISFPLRLEAFLLEGGYNKVGGGCWLPARGGGLRGSHCCPPRASQLPHTPRLHPRLTLPPSCADPQQRLCGSAA